MWSPLVQGIVRRVKSVIRDKMDDGWRVSNLLCGILVAAILLSIVALAWQRIQRPADAEYEGQIVDKWVGFTESDTGSRAYRQLLVEDIGGKRITVFVDNETYQRAQVGMRIRSRASGIELSGKPAQSESLRP